jgi:hypothetical protein
MIIMVIGYVFSLINLVCAIIILIHAFKSSVGEGFLCLCVPCYIIYYMFAKFDHPKKGLILAGFWGSWLLSMGFQFGGMAMSGPATTGYGGTYGY